MGVNNRQKNNKIVLRILSKYFTLVLLILLAGESFAQNRGFSREPDEFIEELGDFVKKVKIKEVDDQYDSLKTLWENKAFSEDQQSVVIRICSHMQIKKFKVHPHYTLLMSTLIAGKDSSISSEKFDNWVNESYKLLKANRRAFLDLLKTSKSIFQENALYVDKSKKWVFSETDYKFVFKNKKIFINLENVDLRCKGPADEILIRNTGGSFAVLTKKWKGTKGVIDWERVGISATDLYAEFDAYEIAMNKAEFLRDSVLLTYNSVLPSKIYGTLKDKISSGRLSQEKPDFSESKYPEFTSYRNDLKISAFGDEQVKFTGGITLEGKNLKGAGSHDEKATFEFYYQDKLTVTASSSSFKITPEKITSTMAKATIFTDSGTIYHPMVQLSFLRQKRRLSLTRGNKGIERAPFFDTDHNMEIWVDQVLWKLEEPKIEFDMILNDDKARFESKNFFRDFNYERLRRGMMSYNPIAKMYKFSIDWRRDSFDLKEYAFAIGSKKENLYQQIYMLADEGFIYYDHETEVVQIKEKLYNYYKNHFKLADYDVIRFVSVIGALPNATLNLVNYDLQLEGVRLFHFSDSQNVQVIPRNQQVTLKNDRRLKFGGRITAGRFDFYGNNFDFNYPGFYINSEQIDSMKLFYPDSTGGKYLIPVKTVLRDLNGTLYIDKPSNKSGIQDYPEYPRFVSRSPAVISYDKKNIFNGAYKKDVFRFEVDPFTIDSMDNFTIEGLTFPGNFVSAGILPEFRYEARIMKDYSLGFERANPPGGYAMYGGKGRANIDISLSEEGFRAKGEINYEGAKIVSRDIIMMPDSTNAVVDEYNIDKSSKYPRLRARDVLTHWMPKNDSMFINTNDHEVDLFSAGQQFLGDLVQTPNQLAGGGHLTWDNAKLSSKAMTFKPEIADADVSRIQIGDIDAGLISFVSENVKSHVDFDKRTGEFRANELGQFAEFNYNQYASTMDDFKWDMDKKTILLTSSGRMPDDKSIFVSRQANQSGLAFQSTKALFDMNTGIIYAEEIPHIDVADSRVFPIDGKAIIEKDAVMRPLVNSKLLAARENKFHELFNCRIRILGKYSISGSGNYVYKDKHLTGQIIHFNKMRVTRDSTVLAQGYISDSLEFSVSPKIRYKGSVDLNSDQEHLSFNGYVFPDHTFRDYKSLWFRYEDQPDPKKVIVDAGDPKNEIRKSVSVSMNVAPVDSINVYPSFFNHKRVYADPELTTDTGVLFYDEEKETFFSGDRGRLLEGKDRGSYMSFNEDTRIIQTEGKLNFGLELQEKYFVKSSGKVYKHEDDTTFSIDAMWAMHMKLPDECYTRIKEVIAKNGADAPKFSVDRPGVKQRLAQLLEEKEYQKLKKEIQDFGELKANDELESDLLFTDTKLYYNKKMRAFTGYDKVELASVKEKVINQSFDSRILVEQKRSGTRVVFYLQVSKYDWFYFEYQRGNLFIYSTDKEFNDAIREKAPKINKQGYIIRMASPTKVDRQLDKTDALR
jgi:hypothetical protein